MPLIQQLDPGSESNLLADAGSVVRPSDDWPILRNDPKVTQEQSQPSTKKQSRTRRCTTCHQAFSGEARFCPVDGDRLFDVSDFTPDVDPLIGEIIDGRYEVIEVLGQGGMGTVYEVRHTTLNRRFALKVLRRDLADAEHAARFIQEAKSAAAIGHPNIVAVSDFGEVRIAQKAVPYFVMEYLIGTPLAALIKGEKTLTPQRIGPILIQCAAGLAAAHGAGVIHRDLKPDNVFLTRSGDHEFVKLLDFGVAKMAGVGRLTGAGMVYGTPHYMSPEQAAGQAVDLRADIYALGVILYESLAGKVPFEADTYMGVLTKHMFATPEPIDRVVPDSSKLGALGPIAMRCLSKNPQERFASMAEFSAAIEASLHEAASSTATPIEKAEPEPPPRIQDAPPPSVQVDSQRLPDKRAFMVPMFVGFGVLACILIVSVLWLGSRTSASEGARPAPSAAPAEAAVALPARPSAAASPAPSAEVKAPPAATPSAAVAETAAPSAQPTAASKPPVRGPSSPRLPPPSAPPPKGPKTKPPRGGDVIDPWAH